MNQDLNVRINGAIRTIPEGTTLKGLIGLFGLKEPSVILELNRQVVERASYPVTALRESDSVEIVQLVGGG